MKRSIFDILLIVGSWLIFLCCHSGTGAFAADQAASGTSKSLSDAQSAGVKKGKGIAWKPYEDGLVLAGDGGKKIFLHFYTDWCHYCKVMEQQTFANQEIIDLLNDNFVAIRVNSEQQSTLASRYNVHGVPVSWFLESSGNRIGSRPGYLDPEQMKEILKFVLSEKYNK